MNRSAFIVDLVHLLDLATPVSYHWVVAALTAIDLIDLELDKSPWGQSG
jgi:hypothetical protein